MAVVCFRRATTVTFAVCAVLLPTAGCSNAPRPADRADYTATLDQYYQGRPACVWPDTVKFPVKDATPDEIDERGFEALADAGLLVRKPASKDAPAGSSTFDLSPEGRSALDPDISNPGAGNFCYGRRTVTSIEAASQNSRSTELIDFDYSVAQPAAWAKQYSIERAFPQVASELAGPHKAEATLLDTTDGWQVSGRPANILPLEAGPRDSAIARAMSLFHLKKRQAS
jgi:hypothetical protein